MHKKLIHVEKIARKDLNDLLKAAIDKQCKGFRYIEIRTYELEKNHYTQEIIAYK